MHSAKLLPALPLAILACSTISGAVAQTTGEDCAAIDDGARRLLCFDLVYRIDRSVEDPSSGNAWTVQIETSRLDDSVNVLLGIESADTFPYRFRGEGRATLAVRCQENTTALIIRMGDHHLADFQNYGRVTYRIDDAAAQTLSFRESTDNRALGLWSGGTSIPFIRQLLGAENLLVQITPFNESPITVDFPVAGLDEAIAPLREACSW